MVVQEQKFISILIGPHKKILPITAVVSVHI